jgi:hypothetical protein
MYKEGLERARSFYSKMKEAGMYSFMGESEIIRLQAELMIGTTFWIVNRLKVSPISAVSPL